MIASRLYYPVSALHPTRKYKIKAQHPMGRFPRFFSCCGVKPHTPEVTKFGGVQLGNRIWVSSESKSKIYCSYDDSSGLV